MFWLRRAMAQAGLMMAGGLFLFAAGGLLAVAAWLELVRHLGPVLASLAVAGGCLVVGVVLLALSGRKRRLPPPRPDDAERDAALRALFAEAGLHVPEKGESPPLMDAFLFGLASALRLRRMSGR